MAKIITKQDDSIFLRCNCGCSILSVYALSEDRFYLQYFGNKKNADFEFDSKEKLEKFITLIIRAYNYIWTPTQIGDYQELELGYVDNEYDGECLAVTVNNYGDTNILKYHKDYKKFKKLYNKCADENRFDVLFECIPYKKCKCDWDIVSYTNQMKEFANELIDKLIPESRHKFEMSSSQISEAHKIEV